MKLTRNKIVIGIFAVVLVGAVAFSQAMGSRGMYGHGFDGGGHILAFFSHYLDLSDAQQAQMKQILEKERPTMQPLLQQLGQGRQQLRQLEETDSFDEAKVRALVGQNSQNLTELIVQKARIESELFQVLTPEQRTKFVDFMNRHHDRFHKWTTDTAQPQS